MSDKKDGGQAFPNSFKGVHGNGMSLLEYYAGEAMAGIVANPNTMGALIQSCDDDHVLVHATIANMSFNLATAMLAQRDRGE